MDDCFQWLKYKCENFHQRYHSALDIESRIKIAAEYNNPANICVTWRIDGVHIPNTRDKSCLNFLVITLMNGFCASILWPSPAQAHDSKVLFGRDDTAVADCSFSMFSRNGNQANLSIVANEFALHNIHCFLHLMIENGILDEVNEDNITNHPFFETNPIQDVEIDADVLVDVLLQNEDPNEKEQDHSSQVVIILYIIPPMIVKNLKM